MTWGTSARGVASIRRIPISRTSDSGKRVLWVGLGAASMLYWWIAAAFVDVEESFVGFALNPLAIACKVASWATVLVVTEKVCFAMRGDSRRARTACLAWWCASMAMLVVLALLRPWLQSEFNTVTTRLTDDGWIGTVGAFPREPRPFPFQASKEALGIWWFVAVEGAVLLLLTAFLSWIGWQCSRSEAKRWCGTSLALSTFLVLWLATWFLGLAVQTYDLFLPGIAVGSMAVDLLVPFLALTPVAPSAAPIPACIALVGALLLIRWEREDAVV